MIGEAELLRVIADIYEAALVPEQWPLALANVAESCGARWGVMGMFPRSGAPSTLHFPPPDPAIVSTFDTHYNVAETNPAIPRLLAAPSGKILRRREELADAEWERTGLYNDIYRPTETHDAVCVKLMCNRDALVVIGFNRLRHLGAFEESHFAALQAAIPHLQRALQTYLRLHDLEAHRAAHEALWNRLNCGVILLSEDGRTLWSNAKAEAILTAADGLQSRCGVLSAATPAETAELGRLVANAALCANARSGAPGGTLAPGNKSQAVRLGCAVSQRAARHRTRAIRRRACQRSRPAARSRPSVCPLLRADAARSGADDVAGKRLRSASGRRPATHEQRDSAVSSAPGLRQDRHASAG
jgi:hypothetical protein